MQSTNSLVAPLVLSSGDIAPMFEARPLKLLFRRKPEPVEVTALERRQQGFWGGLSADAVRSRTCAGATIRQTSRMKVVIDETNMKIVGNIRVEQVSKVGRRNHSTFRVTALRVELSYARVLCECGCCAAATTNKH